MADRLEFDGLDLNGDHLYVARIEQFVPLSVRHGTRRKRFGWWLLGRREAVAFWIAPWLRGPR